MAIRVFANFLAQNNLRMMAIPYFNLVIFNAQFPKNIRLEALIDKSFAGIWEEGEIFVASQSLLKEARDDKSPLQPARRTRARLLLIRHTFAMNSHIPKVMQDMNAFTLLKMDAFADDYAEALFYYHFSSHRRCQEFLQKDTYRNDPSCWPIHYRDEYLGLCKVSEIQEASPPIRARANLYRAQIRVEHLTDEAMAGYRQRVVPENQGLYKDFEVMDDITAHHLLVEASQNHQLFPHEREEATRTLEMMRRQGRAPAKEGSQAGQKLERKANDPA